MKHLLEVTQKGAVLDKAALQRIGETDAIEIIESAEVDLSPLVVQAERVIQYASSLRDTIKKSPECLREVQENVKGGVNRVFGAKIEYIPVKTEYDFSKTPYWNELQDKISELKALQKEVEDFAKKTKEYSEISINGEMIGIYPAIKMQTEGIKVTL